MSSNSPAPLSPRFGVSPPLKIALLVWLVLAIGAYVLLSNNNANTTALHDDVKDTIQSPADRRSNVDSGTPQLSADLQAAREESRRLAEQIERLETAVGGAAGIKEQRRLAKSQQAVEKVKLATFTARIDTSTKHLGKLKQLQAAWAAMEAALLNGEAGQRIAGSPDHLQRIVDLWRRERPSAEDISLWENQLSTLQEPLTPVDSEEDTIAITEEHVKLVTDLGQELKKQAAEFERQKLLLESIQRETSALKPGKLPLADAMEQHQGQQEKAEADRLAQVKETARAEAEKVGAERIAEAERKRVEALSKLKEQEIEADSERLKDDARKLEEDRKWAQLEREMQRDMNEIRGLLLAYTAPGFTYRPDDTKGPVSYSLIKSSGGLEPTRTGLDNLFFMARGNSDRPRGGLPEGVGGILGSGTPSAPIERAQALLVKYGELMVRKEMLAP